MNQAASRGRLLLCFLLAFILPCAAWGFGEWATSGDPVQVNPTVRLVDTGIADLTNRQHKVGQFVTGVFITKSQTWPLLWTYNCIPSQTAHWTVALDMIRLDQQGARLSADVATTRGQTTRLYLRRGQKGWPDGNGIYQEHGPGAYRFVVTIPQDCLWWLRAPADPIDVLAQATR